MKTKCLLLTLLFVFFCSCDKDNDEDNKKKEPTSDNAYVNKWIYEQMATYYYWNNEIPKVTEESFEANPEEFFESILYKRGKVEGDRFSWIQDDFKELQNSLSGVVPYDIGFEYKFYYVKKDSPDLVGEVSYVKPGTDAAVKGVKRGDLFTHVDGKQLTDQNYRSIFQSATAEITFVINKQEVKETIQLVRNYAENPIYLDSIYNEGANKVGYLVYNMFVADHNDNSQKYDLALNDVFGRFKAANITHLVLDLRYNSGGSMRTATYLGSMLVPQLDENNVFTEVKYNEIVTKALTDEYGEDYFLDKFTKHIQVGKSNVVEIKNVGDQLKGLYILTSRSTASASELVINNLDPYMGDKITLIGDLTAGKNLGSITIYEENDRKNKWGMQPIVLKFANKVGYSDFATGIAPDIHEYDNNASKLELGDKDETMLSIALRKINGTYAEKRSTKEGLKVFSSSVSNKPWSNHVTVELDKLNLIKE